MASSERRNLIENAIKFLQDPQVSQVGDLERQRRFLEGKGLSEDEINQAMKAAGIASEGHRYSPPLEAPPLPSKPPVKLTKQTTQRQLIDWGKFALILAFIGSAGMALYQTTYIVLDCGVEMNEYKLTSESDLPGRISL
jgi:hypothetical protein